MGSLFLSAAAALSIVLINVIIVELCGTADKIHPTQPRNVSPESHHATHECFWAFFFFSFFFLDSNELLPDCTT